MKNLGMIMLLFAFFSCSKKVYVKDDYTLYDKKFQLSQLSNLRTDGVYVLENIWTKESQRKAAEHQFYKFYKDGQVNLTVDLDHEIKSNQDYIQSIKSHISKTNQEDFKTHFEGYYRLDGNKIVLQRVTVPRNLFTYNYGYLEDDKLILVKETIDGKGKFEDKYFTDYYKATYKFIPLDKSQLENLVPGW